MTNNKDQPYAYREAVNKELNRMMNEKVIENIDTADWGTRLVVALNPNGKDCKLLKY